jgi:quercetin dioxygenase-like cupin family protein
MERVESLADRHTETKGWGWEEWIVNNDLYCGKRLHFVAKGGRTSLHFHVNKHETMYVESGSFNILMIDTVSGTEIVRELKKGDSIVIKPQTPHRIIAAEVPSVLVEFSTHHENSDSYRIMK